jgi:hypothetical protein
MQNAEGIQNSRFRRLLRTSASPIPTDPAPTWAGGQGGVIIALDVSNQKGVPFMVARLAYLALLLPSPVAAQQWGQPWADPDDRPARVDISASVGFLAPTDWSDLVLLGTISSATGVLEQVLVRDLRVNADEEFAGAVTYWRGRYGFRVQGGFSNSAVVIGGPLTDAFGPPSTADVLSIDVDTYMYDIRGAIGFLEYSPQRWVLPYGFFGMGGITYDLAQRVSPPLLTFVERSRTRPDGSRDVFIVEDDGREFLLAIDELGTETVFAFNFGVGADFRIPLGPAGVGLRLELSDHIASSPVGLRIADLRRSGLLASSTDASFGPVHHLRAAAGFVVQIGR